ncbi:hypothetical protein V6N12_061464 [Hibiscus sabdariffa]|uniref:Uncharacterized protein n=1 Tax=Hibiscus sabdariffa TaxID=183260 RepID=A0ABR2DX47_9ROSI
MHGSCFDGTFHHLMETLYSKNFRTFSHMLHKLKQKKSLEGKPSRMFGEKGTFCTLLSLSAAISLSQVYLGPQHQTYVDFGEASSRVA